MNSPKEEPDATSAGPMDSASDIPADPATLLELYKLYVQMADKVSDRRVKANAFYVSLTVGMLVLTSRFGWLRAEHPGPDLRSAPDRPAGAAGLRGLAGQRVFVPAPQSRQVPGDPPAGAAAAVRRLRPGVGAPRQGEGRPPLSRAHAAREVPADGGGGSLPRAHRHGGLLAAGGRIGCESAPGLQQRHPRLQAEREYCKRFYGDLYHVLYNGPLVEAFLRHDTVANRARTRRRLLGRASVGLAFVALVCITARLLLEGMGRHASATLVYVSEACLLLSLVLPPLVVQPLRHRWLKARLMTERLRQWHFEWILRSGHAIESTVRPSESGGLTVQPAEVEMYETGRDRALARFLNRMSSLEVRLEAALAERLPDLGVTPHPFAADSHVLPRLFAAYDELRFEHQIDYAEGKLAQRAKGSLIRQHRLYSTASTVALVAAVTLCVAVVSLHILEDLELIASPVAASPWWPALAVCFAIGSVAIRALESGFGLASAVARYENYAAAVESLRQRFRASNDPVKKLAIMHEMEDRAAREMTLFLSEQSRSSFGV